MLDIFTSAEDECQSIPTTLDEIAREGARRLLSKALELEVAEYIDKHQGERGEDGNALVVRNGISRPRNVTMGSGTVKVEAPRVNDKRNDHKFTSAILPPYMRRSPNVESLLPILYLKGLSTSDFGSALRGILGEDVSGLSSSSISSLQKAWEIEFDEWSRRTIAQQYAYIWADGVNVKVRLGEDKRLCLLVIMGVNHAGQKHLLAIESGYRESQDSWAEVLRSLKKRGLNTPALAVGDGALGFWAAIRQVYPETKEQRCWVHKIANVLDKLPKRLQATAKKKLHEMMYAETQADSKELMEDFVETFSEKHPKAGENLRKDWEKLTAYFSFPAAHWAHVRTTNPIESTFATVKLRMKITKGAGSPKAAETMAFKLMQEAEKRWRRIKGYESIKNVLKGVAYVDGAVISTGPHQEAAG
jgi:transposase-like protein